MSKEELERIDALEFSYPYDFADIGPNLLEFGQGRRERCNLGKLIANETFPFAALDLVDKLGIDAFDIGSFYSNVNLERIHLPGELSAVTACKTVMYCLEILACEVCYTLHDFCDAKVRQLKIEDLAADKAIRRVRRRAKEWQEGKVEDWINLDLHFVQATKHPFINRAVNNAAVNRWGLSRDVKGSYFKWAPTPKTR